MPRTSETKGKKPIIKGKNLVTDCNHLGNECPCTNLNGSGCKKRQEEGGCKKLNN